MFSILSKSAGTLAWDTAYFNDLACSTKGVALRFFSRARATKPARISSEVVTRPELFNKFFLYGLFFVTISFARHKHISSRKSAHVFPSAGCCYLCRLAVQGYFQHGVQAFLQYPKESYQLICWRRHNERYH